MFGKMKELMELQKKAKEMEKAMGAMKVEKSTRDGKIRLVMNGNQKMESLNIDTSLFAPEQKSYVEKTLTELVSEAGEEVKKKSASQAMEMMKGMNLKLPGF